MNDRTLFFLRISFWFISLICITKATNDFIIRFDPVENVYKQLPRFWKNCGFSPPAPLPINNAQVTSELLSKDVYLNIEYLAALPNFGIQYVRIHWLLSMLKVKYVVLHLGDLARIMN